MKDLPIAVVMIFAMFLVLLVLRYEFAYRLCSLPDEQRPAFCDHEAQ